MTTNLEQALTQMTKPGVALVMMIEADRKKAGEDFLTMAQADRDGVRSLSKALNRLLSYEELNASKEEE